MGESVVEAVVEDFRHHKRNKESSVILTTVLWTKTVVTNCY